MIEENFAAMDAEFKTLHINLGPSVQPHDALEIARRYPREAAISGATATYAIGYTVKSDQPITAKDPMKSGLALIFSKPARFQNIDQLVNAYEISFTQTAYIREAKLIAAIPFINSTIESQFNCGLTRKEFSLLSEIAVWSANFVTTNLINDATKLTQMLKK